MSLSIKVALGQSTMNTPAELLIPTNLTVDGRTGWSIIGMRYSVQPLHNAVPATANSNVFIELNTETGNQLFTDNDSILYEVLQFTGVAASTTARQIFGNTERRLVEPRITVQPNLYLYLTSSGLTAPVTAYVEVIYDIVKLSDIEVLRLMQGGA